MSTKKFSAAMNEIDNRYLEEAMGYQKKGKSIAWMKIGAIAACLVLVAGSGIWQKGKWENTQKTSSGIGGAEQRSEVILDNKVQENSDKDVDESPVYYSSLSFENTILNQETQDFFGTVNADIIAFDESELGNYQCSRIIEGTVKKLYVKHYNYDIYNDKYKKNEVLHGRTDAVVYEVEVDKTWYGSDISGDTILIEDMSYFTEPVLAVKEGGKYVLPLYEYGESLNIAEAEYAGGDIARETVYSTIYPYHPQIVVTTDGSYLVSGDWTTLVANQAKEVIMDTLEDTNAWKNQMYLLDKDTFENQMKRLIKERITQTP